MNSDKIIISGTGCALSDFIYNNVYFGSQQFTKYLTKKSGDGGLDPGKLVFTEELEKFTGKHYRKILEEIIGDKSPDAVNAGGPSLISLIHASQLLEPEIFNVRFFGIAGDDHIVEDILKVVNQTPLDIKNYIKTSRKSSPFTHVLSDPDFNHGQGERTFVNNIGAAWDYSPDQLGEEFFDSDIVCFGGTALVPQIHDNLAFLLGKAKKNNCITIVNTVFDFRNEKKYPGNRWPLVGDKEYGLIDVLIMDCEEALKISGMKSVEQAASFFSSTEVKSFIITNGANDLIAWSNGDFFNNRGIMQLPVSKWVTGELKNNPSKKGDTTGCGDNFAGGVITSIAWQMAKNDCFDLTEAVSWGVASGGFCCFTVGGAYIEKSPGEKRNAIRAIQKEYLNQIEQWKQ